MTTAVQEKPAVPDDNRKAALAASWKRRRVNVAMRIELSALTLFLEHGIDGVTVEEIATFAQISRRSFYRYFESPVQILCMVLCRSMDIWAQFVRERPKTEPIMASFRAANAHTVSTPENAEPLAMAMEIMHRSPGAWRRIAGPMQNHTTSAYQQIIAERLLVIGENPAAAGAIAAALTAIMINLAETSAREGRLLTPDEIEQTLLVLQRLLGVT